MHWLLFLVILIGIVGAVAFLNINKKTESKNEADDYEITEINPKH
jgi:hypothetical protein